MAIPLAAVADRDEFGQTAVVSFECRSGSRFEEATCRARRAARAAAAYLPRLIGRRKADAPFDDTVSMKSSSLCALGAAP
jgi:hypothetical protein